ncbi:DUF6338 family protein [Frankia sp. Cr2]|uniref:DUF6338 family protein n=1 Tax=Frankia sp. Cr2 TaxID=3073932 RepID=UPI002AD350E2|nr:DUF6338 family protein [Frankia sp. Cr2]
MPDGAAQVLVFLFGVAPGYLYHQALNRRVTRDERTGLREAAEIFSAGAFASSVSTLVVLGCAQCTTVFIRLGDLILGMAYIRVHPWQLIWSGLAAALVAAGLAWLAGTLLAITAARGMAIRGGTVWTRVLPMSRKGRRPYLAVELLDGRVVEGFLLQASIDADHERRDLALQPPIMWSAPGTERRASPAGFVVLPGREIRVIQASYPTLRRASPSPPIRPEEQSGVPGPR